MIDLPTNRPKRGVLRSVGACIISAERFCEEVMSSPPDDPRKELGKKPRKGNAGVSARNSQTHKEEEICCWKIKASVAGGNGHARGEEHLGRLHDGKKPSTGINPHTQEQNHWFAEVGALSFREITGDVRTCSRLPERYYMEGVAPRWTVQKSPSWGGKGKGYEA